MLDMLLDIMTDPSGAMMHQFVLIISISAVFYFFMIRPQQRRQKALQAFIAALKRGTPVVTIGGIHARVYSVTDDAVTLEIDHKGTKLTVSKSAITLDGHETIDKQQ